MRVNLKVPPSMNEARIALNVTWRDILKAGIETLKTQQKSYDPLSNLKTVMRPHLIAASKAIKAVDDLLKGDTI